MEKKYLNLIKKLKNKKWRKRGKWFHTTAFSEIFLEGESTVSHKRLNFPFIRHECVWFGNGDYFDLENDYNSIRKKIKEMYRKDKKYLDKYARKCLRHGEKIIKYIDNVRNNNFSKYSDEELLKEYKKIITRCQNYMPYMSSLHLFDEFLSKKFRYLLKKYINEQKLSRFDFFEYQTALTLPFRKIFVLEERDEFFKIAKRDKISEIDIQKHHYKYAWINTVLLEDRPYSIDYYYKRVKEFKKQSDINIKEYQQKIAEEGNLKDRQKELMKEIRNHKDLYRIAKTIQIFGFLRSFRIDVLYIAFGRSWNLIKEISKRLNIKDLDLRYLDYNDIYQAILNKDKTFKEKIRLRKNKVAVSIAINEDRYEMSDLNIINKLKKIVKEDENNLETNIINGAIAYPGKIIGKCKVLHNLNDMKKVKQGDIIVISMTDPNYIPAMERASAFLTDFGGILCHAAIVSREMKKPCIIGTKVATKILQDGDKIELDANNGVVKVLK